MPPRETTGASCGVAGIAGFALVDARLRPQPTTAAADAPASTAPDDARNLRREIFRFMQRRV